MRKTLLAVLLTIALPAGFSYLDAAAARSMARRQAATAAPASAKVWEGRQQEFEEFIRAAPIDRFEDVPIGVTHPKRAYFRPGGLAASVAWKVLPPGRPNGYWESYKSEIAAYELDKLLGIGMVPVAVEKRWKGETAAAILWVAPVHSWKEMQALQKPPKWNRQAIIMKMFDNLIGNKDRNQGNLLVDDDWNLFLIDHSRAFIADKDLPAPMAHVDREVWARMLALDEAALSAALGAWLDRGAIRAMLARRDRMKREIDTMIRTTSEAAVFAR